MQYPIIREKRQADVVDYDIDFTAWLEKRGKDTISSYSVSAEQGSISTHTRKAGVVKAFVSGGEVGKEVKVVCTINTVGGRTKEVVFFVKVV